MWKQESKTKTRGKQGDDMKELLVGNAPCSWGTLEHQDQSQGIPSTQMLDELVETGYTGTELGDWGYMPTDPVLLSEELAKRNHVVMLGAFVPVELKNPLAHAEGTARAVKTARLIAAVATTQAPFLVLADDNGTDARRTKLAGRVPASAGLNMEDLRRRRRPDCARGVRRHGVAHGVSSSLRGLRGDAGRNRNAAQHD
jgi:inosose dehydratase